MVGLGDRHGENILLDAGTADCVHVDFSCLFDKALQAPLQPPLQPPLEPPLESPLGSPLQAPLQAPLESLEAARGLQQPECLAEALGSTRALPPGAARPVCSPTRTARARSPAFAPPPLPPPAPTRCLRPRLSWLTASSIGFAALTDCGCALPLLLPPQGLELDKPEMVPFRLTQNIVDGLGVTGYEGVFVQATKPSTRKPPAPAHRAVIAPQEPEPGSKPHLPAHRRASNPRPWGQHAVIQRALCLFQRNRTALLRHTRSESPFSLLCGKGSRGDVVRLQGGCGAAARPSHRTSAVHWAKPTRVDSVPASSVTAPLLQPL